MRWRILSALLVVLATGWLLAGVASKTFGRAGAVTYPAALTGAAWIEAPGGPQHAYFHLAVKLGSTPELATLWLEADQQYAVYADGENVASSKSPVRSGLPPLADPVDLTWRLRKGQNDIGVEVINNDLGPAAFRAKLSLDFGARQVSYVTSPASWLAASSPRQVRFPGADMKNASFSAVSFDASQWADAKRVKVASAQALSLMPPAIVAGPLTGKVISAGGTHDMLASEVIQLPAGVKYAWLRVIASDAYALSVNGSIVASQPAGYYPVGAGRQKRSQAVGVYNVGSHLRAGRNVLLAHVYGSKPAEIYIDGAVDTASGTVHITTGPGWQATLSGLDMGGQPASQAAVVAGSVGAVWPGGLRRAGVVPDVPSTAGIDAAGQQSTQATGLLPGIPAGAGLGYALTGMALLLALWLASGLVAARITRRPVAPALLVDAAAHLPALAAACAVATIASLPNWVPPRPYVPAVFWLLVAILAVCKLGSLAGAPAGFLGRPGWAPRLPGLLLRDRPPRQAPVMTGRRAVRLPSPAPAFGWLPFPPRLALAEATAQAGAVPVRVAAEPALTSAGWRWRERLHQLPARVRRLAARCGFANACVVLIALAGTGQLAYGLGYQPYSGDETVSLLAAQSIRAHMLPRFPSGLLYLKGELYEYPLAVYTAIVGEGAVAVRMLTIATYGASVLAFGLVLLPLVLRGRHPLARVLLTLVFATAPMELLEAQLVRMYQQEQLFAILAVSFLLLALRSDRVAAGLESEPPAPSGRVWALATRWAIPLSAVSLVAMYLSLEESFIMLPAIPVVLAAGLGLRWVRNRRWLTWGLPAVAIIGVQYLLTLVVKMPALGYDRSNKPYIYYDPSQFYYYLVHYLLAIPGTSGGAQPASGTGTLYLVTSLAIMAGLVGVARRDFSRIYLSAFSWVPVLILSAVFSASAERYFVVLLPGLFALAGLGAIDIAVWLRALFAAGEARQRRVAAGLISFAAIPGFIWLAGSFPARLQDYGLTASRLAGVPYGQQQPAYAAMAAYMRAHEKPGDLFITLASTTDAAFYAGRAPDMVIQPHPNKLLFLTERNGVVIDVYYGKPVILTATDLEQVIATHSRIWLMTDQGPYFDSVPSGMTQLIRAQFTEVAGNAQAALYFRGN
jgi:hypothetical protein